MKKIVFLALTVFLSVVASAQNFDNGCKFSPDRGTTIEAVQSDYCQSDILSVEMNVQYDMPLVCLYIQTEAVACRDFMDMAFTFAENGEAVINPFGKCSVTDNKRLTRTVHRHRYPGPMITGPMIRQVQAA